MLYRLAINWYGNTRTSFVPLLLLPTLRIHFSDSYFPECVLTAFKHHVWIYCINHMSDDVSSGCIALWVSLGGKCIRLLYLLPG